MQKTAMILLLALACSCVNVRKPVQPSTSPDPNCDGACAFRERKKAECGYDASVSMETCVARCNEVEVKRPGTTGATCVSVAVTCEDVKACEKGMMRR